MVLCNVSEVGTISIVSNLSTTPTYSHVTTLLCISEGKIGSTEAPDRAKLSHVSEAEGSNLMKSNCDIAAGMTHPEWGLIFNAHESYYLISRAAGRVGRY